MSDTTDASTKPVPAQGWQCPLCKTVHAPWAAACHCQQAMMPWVNPGWLQPQRPVWPRPHPSYPLDWTYTTHTGINPK